MNRRKIIICTCFVLAAVVLSWGIGQVRAQSKAAAQPQKAVNAQPVMLAQADLEPQADAEPQADVTTTR